MTTTRAPFLTETYGGYQHREVPGEDAEITRVGPGDALWGVDAPVLGAGCL